jgi:hypothetical protein
MRIHPLRKALKYENRSAEKFWKEKNDETLVRGIFNVQNVHVTEQKI